jgi:tol-pal system protein YbgF
MRRPLALLVVAGAGILLSACATRGSVREVNTRLTQIAKDISDIRRDQQIVARESAVAVVEIRALNGRLRDAEVRLRDTADRVAALGNRVAAAEASLRETITSVEALQRPPAAAPVSVVPPPRAEDAASPAAELAFASALKTFRAGEHGQAVLELTDFIGKFPRHPLAARAQLWIGDAYFKQRDYRQALLEYRKAVDAAAPDSPAAADAWLKIGQAYASLRERPSAAAAWQRVMRQYPDTAAADQARTLLRK